MKVLAVVGLALLATLMLPGPVPTAEAGPGPVVVAAFWQYAPQAIVVSVGTPVTWINPLPTVDHTWTTANSVFDAFADIPNDPADTNCGFDGQPGEDGDPDTCDVPLVGGSSLTHTFSNANTYVYYCRVHLLQKMVAVVHVV